LRSVVGLGALARPRNIRLGFACQPEEDSQTPAVIPSVIQTKAEGRDELATLPGVTREWIEMRRASGQGGQSAY